MHDHNHEMSHTVPSGSRIKQLTPLLVLFASIVTGSLVLGFGIFNYDWMEVMALFMGIFFLVFGAFKVMKLQDFATAYQEYDVIAKRSRTYALIYPLIEVGLGIAYVSSWNLDHINIITIVIMLVGAYGVYQKLRQHEVVPCACLGTVFKVPMTWVTLVENLLMVAMATVMIIV